MQVKSATFITSSPNLKLCPPPSLPEFAFFGRSNVGKSSLINTLTDRKSLAKASNTPGKTRLFNFFEVEIGQRDMDCHGYASQGHRFTIVDLPGYGYAKTNQKEKKSWLDTTQSFLTTRSTLKILFLLIDASIPPQKIDLEMVETLIAEKVNFAIVFTKIDKVSQKDKMKTINFYKQKYASIETFQVSNKTKRGRDEVLEFMIRFF